MTKLSLVNAPVLLDANELPAAKIDLFFNAAQNVYLSPLYYLKPTFQSYGEGGYDYVDLTMEIEDDYQDDFTFPNTAVGSSHYDLPWPDVTNPDTFMYAFILSASPGVVAGDIVFLFHTDTHGGGAINTETLPFTYTVKLNP